MAIVEVKVPQLSESVAEATLLQWKKHPGERVEMDEILIEIETDKVVLEVPAPAAGVIAQLVKNDGESCIAEEVIAKIDTEGIEATSPLDVKPVPPGQPAPGRHAGRDAATGARCGERRARDAGRSQADGRQPHSGRLGAGHRQGWAGHQGRRARLARRRREAGRADAAGRGTGAQGRPAERRGTAGAIAG